MSLYHGEQNNNMGNRTFGYKDKSDSQMGCDEAAGHSVNTSVTSDIPWACKAPQIKLNIQHWFIFPDLREWVSNSPILKRCKAP